MFIYLFLSLECWDNEPDNRPSIHEVVERLKAMISQSSTTLYQQQNENIDTESTISTNNKQIISQNILHENELNLNIKELEFTTSTSDNIQMNDLSTEVDEITKFIFEITNNLNEVNEKSLRKQYMLDYFNNHNINSKEIYNWLLNNQNNNLNSIFLLGYFNYYGIVTNENHDKAFNL